jgi:hypothetical protein
MSLGRFFRTSSDAIDADTALEIARRECERRAVAWREPVKVRRRRHRYIVWTNADRIGGNIKLDIDARTGTLLKVWGPLPR